MREFDTKVDVPDALNLAMKASTEVSFSSISPIPSFWSSLILLGSRKRYDKK